MSHELMYTSVPQGLKPGSKGFCTVAMTAGMPVAIAERLESLSGYRPIFAGGDTQTDKNPVLWAHWRFAIQGRTRSILSRVTFAGFDYSQRTNKFAHHISLEPNELVEAGPAWAMLQPGVMETSWRGEPRTISAGRALPAGMRPPGVYQQWAALTGDAGWGGVLAEAAVAGSKPVFVIYQPSVDLLRLFEEALALIPPAQRWQVTFCTYFTELPMGMTCHWRGVVAGTPLAKEVLQMGSRAVVLDLTKPAGRLAESPFVLAARAVKFTEAKPPASLDQGLPDDIPVWDDDTVEAPADWPVTSHAVRTGRRLGEPKRQVAPALEELSPEHLPLEPSVSFSREPAFEVKPVRRGAPWWLVGVAAGLGVLLGVVGGYSGHDQLSTLMRRLFRHMPPSTPESVAEPTTPPKTQPATLPKTQPATLPKTPAATQPKTQPATQPKTQPATLPATLHVKPPKIGRGEFALEPRSKWETKAHAIELPKDFQVSEFNVEVIWPNGKTDEFECETKSGKRKYSVKELAVRVKESNDPRLPRPLAAFVPGEQGNSLSFTWKEKQPDEASDVLFWVFSQSQLRLRGPNDMVLAELKPKPIKVEPLSPIDLSKTSQAKVSLAAALRGTPCAGELRVTWNAADPAAWGVEVDPPQPAQAPGTIKSEISRIQFKYKGMKFTEEVKKGDKKPPLTWPHFRPFHVRMSLKDDDLLVICDSPYDDFKAYLTARTRHVNSQQQELNRVKGQIQALKTQIAEAKAPARENLKTTLAGFQAQETTLEKAVHDEEDNHRQILAISVLKASLELSFTGKPLPIANVEIILPFKTK